MTTPTSATAATETTTPPPVATDAAKPAEAAKPADAAPADVLAMPSETKPADAAKPATTEAKPLTLKLPEGFNLPEAELAGITKLFTEAKVSPEAAQGIFDGYLKLEQARAAEDTKRFAAQTEKWVADLKADKEFGGANWDASMALIKRGTEAFGAPAVELRRLLVSAGLGSHPAAARLFAEMGRRSKEDSVAGTGGAPAAEQPKDVLRVTYPTMFPKES